MSFNFSIQLAFKGLGQETSEKRESMLTPPDRAIHDLIDFTADRFGVEAVTDINRTILYIKNLQTKSTAHTAMNAYLVHPIRLAFNVGRIMTPPQLDLLHLALLHNVYEVAGLKEIDLEEAGFCKNIQDSVRVLTMDRDREFDVQYLEGYYRHIEEFSHEAMLIKCLDKLDNILGLELMEEGEARSCYLTLALSLVAPMAYRLSPDLGNYFCEACRYMQRVGSQTALCQQYFRYIQDKEIAND